MYSYLTSIYSIMLKCQKVSLYLLNFTLLDYGINGLFIEIQYHKILQRINVCRDSSIYMYKHISKTTWITNMS